MKNTKRKGQKKKTILNTLLFFIFFGIIGFFLGYISNFYLNSYIEKYILNEDFLIKYTNFLGLLFALVLGYLFHIIIHELGHLIFGLLTGYKFVSFRIGSYTIVKSNGLKIKKFNIPGTAGQCLMMPPELKDGKFPFVIYNLGGVIFNSIISIFFIFIGINTLNTNYFSLHLIIIGFIGIFISITNGIPMKIGGIANDGHNILSMIQDNQAKKGFYLQLKVNGLQCLGMRIKDMPLESFKIKDNSDITNPLNTSLKLLEYNWYLDNMDFINAAQVIETLVPYLNKLIPVYRYEINCERIFLNLVNNIDKVFIDDLYDQNLKKYIKAARFMINKKRILMAYEYFYNNDINKALKYYEELNRLSKKYPIKGEAHMELMLADWIKTQISV